jgi:hypothetical protein
MLQNSAKNSKYYQSNKEAIKQRNSDARRKRKASQFNNGDTYAISGINDNSDSSSSPASGSDDDEEDTPPIKRFVICF